MTHVSDFLNRERNAEKPETTQNAETPPDEFLQSFLKSFLHI